MYRDHWQWNRLSHRRKRRTSFIRTLHDKINFYIDNVVVERQKTSVTTSNRRWFVPFAGHPSSPDTTPVSLVHTHFILQYRPIWLLIHHAVMRPRSLPTFVHSCYLWATPVLPIISYWDTCQCPGEPNCKQVMTFVDGNHVLQPFLQEHSIPAYSLSVKIQDSQ